MRVGIGGFRHETNSFSNVVTTVDRFQDLNYEFGQELIAHNIGGVRTPLGGFIDEAAVLGIELAPTFYANATPSGHITPETLKTLTANLVDNMWQQHTQAPLDAIALTLHGAGVSDLSDDIEGYLLQALRQRFGDANLHLAVADGREQKRDGRIERGDDCAAGERAGFVGYEHVSSLSGGQPFRFFIPTKGLQTARSEEGVWGQCPQAGSGGSPK